MLRVAKIAGIFGIPAFWVLPTLLSSCQTRFEAQTFESARDPAASDPCLAVPRFRNKFSESSILESVGFGVQREEWASSPWADWILALRAGRSPGPDGESWRALLSGLYGLRFLEHHLCLAKDDGLMSGTTGRPAASCLTEGRQERTFDGACTLKDVWQRGMPGELLARDVSKPALWRKAESGPDVEVVARVLLVRQENKGQLVTSTEHYEEQSSLNALAPLWLDFIMRDWFAFDGDLTRLSTKAQIPREREAFPENPGPTPHAPGHPFGNRTTVWWDASQVYPTDPEALEKARDPEHRERLSLTTPIARSARPTIGGLIPQSDWLGQALMTDLIRHEHNWFVEQLKRREQKSSPDTLFAKARLYVSALMVKITLSEWAPAVLGDKSVGGILRDLWQQRLIEAQAHAGRHVRLSKTSKDLSSILQLVASHLLPFAKPLLEKGFPWTGIEWEVETDPERSGLLRESLYELVLTEEFRMALEVPSFLPGQFASDKRGGTSLSLLLGESGRERLKAQGHDYWLEVFAFTPAGVPGLGRDPALPSSAGERGAPSPAHQMSAALLARDRLLGMPRFNELRANLGFPLLRSFGDFVDGAQVARLGQVCGTPSGWEALSPDSLRDWHLQSLSCSSEEGQRLRKIVLRDIVQRDILASVYGSVDDVDSRVALLVSPTRVSGSVFSETASEIILFGLARLVLLDRFFGKDFRPTHYGPFAIETLASRGFADVLKAHAPAAAQKMRGSAHPFSRP